VPLGIVAATRDVLEATAPRDRLRRLEARAGIRDEPDAGQDLVLFDDNLVSAVDADDPRRAVAKRGVDPLGPEVGRLEHVRIRRQDQHRRVFLT